MKSSVEGPLAAGFEARRPMQARPAFRAAMNRLAFATVALVMICIFAAICAGAALAAALLSAY